MEGGAAGVAPGAEPSRAFAHDLPRFRRGSPVPGRVPAFSTTNYQLVDVYTNDISGGLNSIYVVPL